MRAQPRKSRRITAKATPGPGYEGRVEIGTLAVIDPYDGSILHAQGNIRHDILIRWKSRKQIDDAQFAAGIKLQGIWYRAQAGSVGTCLPENDRVDVSGIRDPIPSRVVAAQQQLSGVAALLGARDYELVRKVVCEGAKLYDIPFATKRQQEYASQRVRDALTDLAEEWGLIAKGKQSLPITVHHACR